MAENLQLVTEERLDRNFDVLTQYYEHWLAYPDLLVDFLKGDINFNLFFYQRMFLRIGLRYRYMFATFTRAFSKSFLAILILYLRCMLLPGSKVFICAGVKEQAAKIAREKIHELWDLMPILKEEMSNKVGEKPRFDDDYVRLVFKNGSILDVVSVSNSTRGGRCTSGLMEEVILIDGDQLNEVILPLMNINRRRRDGKVNPREPHQAQIYVTSAGYKQSFAYEKNIEILVRMITNPKSSFCWGGDYRIPVYHGLLSETYIEEIKESTTYKPESFNREYLSRWSGNSEESFFKFDVLEKNRVLRTPEYKANKRGDSFYVISIDVGRLNAQTAILIFKVHPRQNYYLKKLVNIITLDNMHFSQQTAEIKHLIQLFEPEGVVIDGNGLGVGLLDYMIQNTVDEKRGLVHGPIGIRNDEEYQKIQPLDAPQLIYVIKANEGSNSDMHINCLSQIGGGKVEFLISEAQAKEMLLNSKKGQALTPEQRLLTLVPYQLTTILHQEMSNLRPKVEAAKVVLERINRRYGKDKFSALEYGLWYIKMLEDEYLKNRNKKKYTIEDLLLMN